VAPAFAQGGRSAALARARSDGGGDGALTFAAAAAHVLTAMQAFLAGTASTGAVGVGDDGADDDDAGGSDDAPDDAADDSFHPAGGELREIPPVIAPPATAAATAGGGLHMTSDGRPLRFIRIASSRKEVAGIVRRALLLLRDERGDDTWCEVPPALSGSGSWWNCLWSWGKPPVNRNTLLTWQRVNHFAHARELTRKDMLKRNLSRYQVLGPKMATAFALQPPTYVLPKEYLAFAEAFGRATASSMSIADFLASASLATGSSKEVAAASASAAGGTSSGGGDALSKLVSAMGGTAVKTAPVGGSGGRGVVAAPAVIDPNLWIMKPASLSRGRGITLVADIAQVRVSEGASVVIQKYVHNPLLLDGHKFDLRLYVLVTSFAPLEAFPYRRGFARLSSRPFTADASHIADRFIHLTNSSVQKHSETAKAAMAALPGADAGAVGGTKCSLEYLWRRLRERGIDTDAVWTSIIDLVVKSLVCVDDVIPHQPNAFELYGYDVLIDATLKPWLVEVNGSPSLGVDSEMDLSTKTELLADTLALVDPLPFDRSAVCEVLRRRAAGKAGAAASSAAVEREQLDSDLSTMLYGVAPRVLGTPPTHLGHYQCICPGSNAFNRAMMLKMAQFRSVGAAGSGARAAAGGK